jgi:membrane dipeptidase
LRFLVIVDTSSLRLFLRAILSLSTCPISGGHFRFVGVNGWPPFVSDAQRPTFDQFFAHIDHIVQLVGPDHAAIGMDYFQLIQGVVPDDEVKKIYDQLIARGAWTVVEYGKPPYVYPTGLETPATMFNMTGGFLERGYSVADVQKIMGGNWLRVMKQVIG